MFWTVRVIAIDGPAGSGKSTIARRLAIRLGLEYLDTGAMYRGVTFAALRRGIDPADDADVARMVADVDLTVEEHAVVVDGVDATIEIRGPEVTRAVSLVAANADVRTELVRRQRAWAAERGGGVLEGRDIGTVVCPDAEVKFYLDAALDERARRRQVELRARGIELAEDAARSDIAARDTQDSSRALAPLRKAPDAIEVDSTGLSVEQVVSIMADVVERRRRCA
jgi:CMP/dCMP kinase